MAIILSGSFPQYSTRGLATHEEAAPRVAARRSCSPPPARAFTRQTKRGGTLVTFVTDSGGAFVYHENRRRRQIVVENISQLWYDDSEMRKVFKQTSGGL
ncbi:MAG: hypothetical protein KA985_03905 [Selenomonas sp.]|nr:hypothetical protein [Selenomonas sp.]